MLRWIKNMKIKKYNMEQECDPDGLGEFIEYIPKKRRRVNSAKK